jgi:hypothetical protein
MAAAGASSGEVEVEVEVEVEAEAWMRWVGERRRRGRWERNGRRRIKARVWMGEEVRWMGRKQRTRLGAVRLAR